MRIFLIWLIIQIGVVSGAMYAQETGGVFTYKTGDVKISLLSETQRDGKIDILIGTTSDMLQEYAPNGVFPNAVNAFLVQTPDKTILIDAGFGSKLFDNIQSLGVTLEQVDVVLITHMHGDHIGGMLRDGEVSFPKAEVYMSQKEYDYWVNKEIMNQQPESRRSGFKNAQKVVEAYKDKLKLFNPNTIGEKPVVLFSGIQGIAAYGHSPGHALFLVESNNEKMLIWGDLTHAMVIQMPYPQVAVTYDTDTEQAITSRLKVLEYVAKNDIPIAGMHIAFPAMGKIIGNSNGGYTFIPFTK